MLGIGNDGAGKQVAVGEMIFTLGAAGVVLVAVGAGDGRVATLGTVGSVWMLVAKISASCLIACIWASPMLANGEAGAGLLRAWVRAAAASRAASAEDVFGMGELTGKNSTVSAIRSEAVLIT